MTVIREGLIFSFTLVLLMTGNSGVRAQQDHIPPVMDNVDHAVSGDTVKSTEVNVGAVACAAPAEGDEGPMIPSGTGEGPHVFIPPGCSGHCYVEMYCNGPGFTSYVGCYGSNSAACRTEGSYVVCNGEYYSCSQCAQQQPFALGCEFCGS